MKGLRLLVLASSILFLAITFNYLGREPALGSQGSPPDDPVDRMIFSNNRGVALMEQLKFDEAAREFHKVIQLNPQFAPGHANLGIAHFNLQQYEDALPALQSALELSPGLIQAHFILGLIYRNQDQVDLAIREFEEVARQDPDDPSTNYYLGLLHSRLRDYEASIRHLRRVIEREPYNASAHYNLAIGYMRREQREEGHQAMEEFRRLQGRFGTTTVGLQYLEQGRYSAVIENLEPFLPRPDRPDQAPLEVRFVEVAGAAGLDFRHAGPGEIDWGAVRISDLEGRIVPYFGSGVAFADYDGDGWLDIYIANAGSSRARGALFRNRGDGTFEDVTARSGIEFNGQTMAGLWGDFDNDGYPDLYLVNFGSNVLYRNNGNGTFTDVTLEAGVGDPAWGLSGAFVDFDHDGDLDIVVANFMEIPHGLSADDRFREAVPGARNVLYRNNGDGTFTDVSAGSGIGTAPTRSLSVICTDFDESRDIDLFFLNWAQPHQLFSNLRDGTFEDMAEPAGLAAGPAGPGLALGDFNRSGFLDFVLPSVQPRQTRLAVNEGNQRFRLDDTLASLLPPEAGPVLQAEFFDFDNDGDLDLLLVLAPILPGEAARGGGPSLILLENRDGKFVDATTRTGLDRYQSLPLRGVTIGDFDNDGDLDILLNVNGGAPLLLRNDGGNQNNWIQVDLRGTNGNTQGIGTKVEVRAGRLWQKLEVNAGTGFLSQNPSIAHFGLGSHEEVDIVRMLWPGGVLQSEVQQPVNRRVTLRELDRKGTSCPILYVWDGETYRYQTDFLGGSAYGYLLAPGVYNYPDTDEYIKLNRQEVALKDGRKLAITLNNQLEEVILFDQVELVVVDHPAQYEVFPDEKLLPGPPYHEFQLFSASSPRPPVAARDGTGNDILPALKRVDRIYPDIVRELPFKGYAELHEMILDLGDVSPERTILLMYAWIDYADSTSNLAASQAGLQLVPPYLQVRDSEGDWVTVLERMGFPAGLPKTMTVDLSGKFLSDSREVRIVTNMRIYWDQILVESGPARHDYNLYRLPPTSAELRFRGFPKFYSPDGREPKVYDYDRISPTEEWKAHIGGYTRFGDVEPLLVEKNDRFVITRAGDEVEVLFDVSGLPSTPPGWVRDYLVYVVGFGKDMDPNSASPDSIGPLPFHGMPSYPYPEDLEYPDLEAHLEYLRTWNTRVVDRWYADLRPGRR